MSLSPEAYEKSIGIASVTREESPECYGSVLLYRNGNMSGESPCGCDGWPVYFDHARLCLYSDVSGEDKLYPPTQHP